MHRHNATLILECNVCCNIWYSKERLGRPISHPILLPTILTFHIISLITALDSETTIGTGEVPHLFCRSVCRLSFCPLVITVNSGTWRENATSPLPKLLMVIVFDRLLMRERVNWWCVLSPCSPDKQTDRHWHCQSADLPHRRTPTSATHITWLSMTHAYHV